MEYRLSIPSYPISVNEFMIFITKNKDYAYYLSNINYKNNIISAGISNSGAETWTQSFIFGKSIIPLNQFIHYAIVRNGNTLLYFENGVLINSSEINISNIINDTGFTIGSWHKNLNTNYLKGNIDELRLSDIAKDIQKILLFLYMNLEINIY